MQGGDAYELITAAARRSPPGANGLLVLPHWNGAGTGRIPPLDPASRGAIFGLTLAHTRDDLSRAVFEGITLETRYLLESFESAGIRIDSLAVTGGGAKSPFWLQLKADVTGKVIRVPRVTEASLLGAAILAGVGAGVYSGVEEAVERVCRVEGEYHPDPAAAKVYDRLFPALPGGVRRGAGDQQTPGRFRGRGISASHAGRRPAGRLFSARRPVKICTSAIPGLELVFSRHNGAWVDILDLTNGQSLSLPGLSGQPVLLRVGGVRRKSGVVRNSRVFELDGAVEIGRGAVYAGHRAFTAGGEGCLEVTAREGDWEVTSIYRLAPGGDRVAPRSDTIAPRSRAICAWRTAVREKSCSTTRACRCPFYTWARKKRSSWKRRATR